MNEIVDVIVTYNRIELLKENINALLNQTYENHDILIIDNASTDGTEDMVLSISDERVKYINTGANLGGAGGFSFGVEQAIKRGYKYAWIMDDDSIPDSKALESLIDKAKILDYKFSYLASIVKWTDNELFPMNVPTIKKISRQNAYIRTLSYIDKYRIMPIYTSSFVGCFVNLSVAEIVGIPIAKFFIYGDDVEYTARLQKKEPAYLDLDSLIIHKAPSNKGADIVTADKDRIKRFYYQSRNGMYIARKNHQVFRRFFVIFKRFFKILFKAPNYRFRRIRMLIKGSFVGLFFNPKIKYVKYEENK